MNAPTIEELTARVAELEAETVALRYLLRQIVATLKFVPMLDGGDSCMAWLRQNVNHGPQVAVPARVGDL